MLIPIEVKNEKQNANTHHPVVPLIGIGLWQHMSEIEQDEEIVQHLGKHDFPHNLRGILLLDQQTFYQFIVKDCRIGTCIQESVELGYVAI